MLLARNGLPQIGTSHALLQEVEIVPSTCPVFGQAMKQSASPAEGSSHESRRQTTTRSQHPQQ